MLDRGQVVLPRLRKLSNVTVTDETPRITVIRAPETISDSQAWLQKYKSKNLDAPAAGSKFVAHAKSAQTRS
jgi:hypothetical protein